MAPTRLVQDDPLNAFCPDTDAYLAGASEGPLKGLSFAAKDVFDVAGQVTGAGNPDWKATHGKADRTAWAVQVLVAAGATMVGKTRTDELTRGIFGENAHYGTPVNPRAPGRVPGGSSSGSASAVAGGLVDFALGSDTNGSVRVPASFCGLYGMRPTHGRISLDGVLKNAPDCDTVGWFARDAELCARIGEILLQSETPKVFPRHLVVAQDAFDLSDPDVATALQPTVDRVASLVASSEHLQLSPAGLSAWPEQQLILTARQALDSAQCWIERVNPRFGFDVAQRYANALSVTAADLAAARQARAAIRNRIDAILQDDVVICLPTTPVPAPPLGQTANQRKACRQRIVSLTCIAGTCGIPQISLPLAAVGGLPVGLSLMGARGADELIVGFAREVAATAAP